VADAWTTVYRAASDRTSGASEIAAAAAEAIAALTADDARKAVLLLVNGHPTMAPLWRLASEVLDGPAPGDGVARFMELLGSDEAAADALSSALTPWVLTISYSSSVVRALRSRRRLAMVTCMESQPGGEGARMAESVSEFANARVVPDPEALAQVPGGVVAVGCDALTPAAVVNKTKTRALVEAARERDVPCYAVAGWSKLVAEPVPVEEPFEPTPLELFTAVATPDGLLPPDEASRRAGSASLHDDLRPVLSRLLGERRRASS
jgi:translation initiation factor 2B subunit (eIF-2B alpha/beta/delta family)